jgi:uncharacterized protein YabE (DUF348 family)
MKINKVTVTFDFEPEQQVVTNLVCTVDGVEKKKRTSRKKTTPPVLEKEAIITREDNRLVFNNKAFADMELSSDNRIILKYEKLDNIRVPIIGTDTAFGEEGGGNKVTKNQTISYRGKVNTILAEYGTTFTIESYKNNLWKLISDNIQLQEQPMEDMIPQQIDDSIFTGDKEDSLELEKLPFKL